MQRREFLQTSTMVVGTSVLATSSQAEDETRKPALTLGLLTDIHYADKPPRGTRHYRDSLAKAEEATEFFKQNQPDLILCLGDLIDAAPSLDEEIAHLRTISATLDKSGIPRRHVIGNHCVHTLTKEEFFKHAGLNQTQGHFSEEQQGIRLIVLDACFNREMASYQRKNFDWKDSNIPAEQLRWLRAELKKSDKPAVVFVHQRIDIPPADPHAVKQSPQVRRILEESRKVTAVFQGHSHKNELNSIQGIEYCTLAAMIEGDGLENNAYSLLDIYPDGSMRLKGYRKQVDRRFGS